MKSLFTKHPNSVGESYLQHAKFAFIFGFNMVFGGLACLLHAIFPFLFEKTGSNILMKMLDFYVRRIPSVEGRLVELCKSVQAKKQMTEIKHG